MLDAVCMVCGEPLTANIVRCPACESPHHRDCWEYNHGCSIYGCASGTPAPVVVAHPAPPPARTTETTVFPRALAINECAVAGCIVGFLMALVLRTVVGSPPMAMALGAIAAGLVAGVLRVVSLIVEMSRSGSSIGADLPTSQDDDGDGLVLEKKAVSRLIGTGASGPLLHAYALFEQRHPRACLDPFHQKALAVELLKSGCLAHGIEAAGKWRRVSARGSEDGPRSLDRHPRDSELDELIRDFYRSDPAFALDALDVPDSSEGGAAPANPFQGRLGAPVVDPHGNGSFYAACLDPRGWEPGMRLPFSHPALPAQGLPPHGRLMCGPLSATAVARVARERIAQGASAIVLPASSVSLTGTIEHVGSVHLTTKDARLSTNAREHVVPWDEVRCLVYGCLDRESVEEKISQEIVLPIASHRSANEGLLHETRTLVRKDEFVPIIEIQFGDPLIRARIDRPAPHMFGYLGRRLSMGHDRNMTIVARDLVRFAPRARVSHGLLHLLQKRIGPGSRFASLEEFEEHVIWFAALGTAAAREAVAPILKALPSEK